MFYGGSWCWRPCVGMRIYYFNIMIVFKCCVIAVCMYLIASVRLVGRGSATVVYRC